MRAERLIVTLKELDQSQSETSAESHQLLC